MANDPLTELESVLHLLTPDELRLAEALLTPTADDFARSLPDDVLAALILVTEQLALSRGAESANYCSAANEDAVLFDPDGAALPYVEWSSRRTGRLLTDAEKARLGPLAAGEAGVNPLAPEVLSLLPEAMRGRLVEARGRGYWAGP